MNTQALRRNPQAESCMNSKHPTTFRLLRALVRTMGKTEWEFRRNLYGVSRSNFLRQKGEEDSCPLTFTWRIASGQLYRSRDWQTVGHKLGFNAQLAELIILAADHGEGNGFGTAGGTRRRIRRILLRAAGLKEPQ